MLISLIRDPVIPEGWQHVAGGCAKRHPRFPSDDDPIPEGSQNEQACAISSAPSEKSVLNPKNHGVAVMENKPRSDKKWVLIPSIPCPHENARPRVNDCRFLIGGKRQFAAT
jgi:hypothetical protein